MGLEAGSGAKSRNEAFLRRHHKVVAPLLIAFLLALFIVPWFFTSFLGALSIQICGAGMLFILARLTTTAFSPRTVDDDDGEPEVEEEPKEPGA